MDFFYEYNVFNFVELLNGRKVIGSKWVFCVKYNVDGLVERCKVRFVVYKVIYRNMVWIMMKYLVLLCVLNF